MYKVLVSCKVIFPIFQIMYLTWCNNRPRD